MIDKRLDVFMTVSYLHVGDALRKGFPKFSFQKGAHKKIMRFDGFKKKCLFINVFHWLLGQTK